MVNWNYIELGEITRQISEKNKDGLVEDVVSVTKYTGIVDSSDYFNAQVYSKDLNGYKIIKRNQFAYATIHLNEGSIGYLKHRDIACLSPMYTVFELDNSKMLNEFLFLLLKSEVYINLYKSMGNGSINRRISIGYKEFAKILVPNISLKEQQKIIDVIGKTERHIHNIEQQINKTTELKKALVKKLLTEGIGHVEFKESDVGHIPAEWESINVEDVSERVCVGYVGSCNKDYTDPNNGVKMIRTTNLSVDKILENDMKYISYDFHKKNKKSQLKKNDVLIARHGDNGKACIYDTDDEANCLNIVIIRPNQKLVNSHFLKESINAENVTKQINLRTVGSVQNVLNTKTIADLKIAVPPLEEQIKISKVLNEVDLITAQYIHQKLDYTQLKDGLMQQLLTGKIRVKVD